MNVGQALLVAAFAAGALSLVEQAARLHGRLPTRLLRLRWALPVSIAAATAALALLAAFFLAGRVSVEYVWQYSTVRDGWAFRLVGVWAAQKGTILLWAVFTGWAVAWFVWRGRGLAADSGPTMKARDWTVFFATVVFMLFIWLSLRQDTFAATPERLLMARPMGNGLNPLLRSPWILIHPPLEFLGYGMLALPAAGGLAWFVSGDKAWSRLVALDSRLTWVVYTLALALGAVWAYYTLSFGGYWAWDPVEVANLVPWIILTAFLHARSQHERHGTHATLAPLLAILALALTLFQTIATRSGLWMSVHAFTDPTGTFAQDPFLRLSNILHADMDVAALVGVLVVFLLITYAVAAHRAAADTPRYAMVLAASALALAGAFITAPASMVAASLEAANQLAAGRTAAGLVAVALVAVLLAVLPRLRRQRVVPPAAAAWSAQAILSWAVLTISLGAAVIFLALLRGVNGVNRQVFDDWVPALALPVVLLMVPAFAHGRLGHRHQATLMGLGFAAGLVAAVLFRPWPVALLAPGLAIAALLGVFRTAEVLSPRGRPLAQRIAAACLLTGGLAALLFWANPPVPPGLGPLVYPGGSATQMLGVVAAIAGLFLLVPACRSGRSGRMLAVAALQVALLGYGVSLVAGIVAIAVMLARPEGFARPDAMPAARARRAYRPVGVHLVHLAVLMALAGYCASTYLAVPTQEAVLGRGEATTSHGWTLTYVEAGLSDVDEEGLRQVDAALQIERGGRVHGLVTAGFHWEDSVAHFDPETAVLPAGWHDVVVSSAAFCTDPTGACRLASDWVESHENGPTRLAPGTIITAIAFDFTILPGMALVWGSVLAMATGVVFIIIGTPPRGVAAVHAHASNVPTLVGAA